MSFARVSYLCAIAGTSWAAQIDTFSGERIEIDLTNIPHVLNNLEAAFNHWLSLYPRVYAADGSGVPAERLDAFKSNAEFVHAHNRQYPSTVLHLNEFADMSFEEFKSTRLGLDTSLKSESSSSVRLDGFRHAVVTAPDSVDWTTSGAVTPIKNQGQCGSCWAFSTTGSIEGINYLKTGELVSLSEEELVDCDANGDHGCSGGLMDNAFTYVVQNGGIDTEKDYSYWGSAFSFCNRRKEADRHVVTISGYEDVPKNDEGALAQAVAAQPVSVAICANHALQLYHSGVFDGDCCDQINHGVLAVGYGTDDNGSDYWKVKNSWGSAWGESGFFRLQKGRGGGGQCAVASYASYPVKDDNSNPHVSTICDPQLFSWWECPYGTKCNCDFNLFGLLCLTYDCEPKDAVACDSDGTYCPTEAPECDMAAERCTSADGLSSPMMTIVPATRRGA
eukprot:jgi/Ulvmu1/1855/UM012_0011.1